ncbi:hypothetical protein HBB16_15885 [Pseudonocardia sp. MCCB 268]|nr:hypothetical protein [Pseudonocardia cytotoxica]
MLTGSSVPVALLRDQPELVTIISAAGHVAVSRPRRPRPGARGPRPRTGALTAEPAAPTSYHLSCDDGRRCARAG